MFQVGNQGYVLAEYGGVFRQARFCRDRDVDLPLPQRETGQEEGRR